MAATGRRLRLLSGLIVLPIAAGFLVQVIDAAAVRAVLTAVMADPAGLGLALTAYAAAFLLRAAAWRATLPGLGLGHSWAALHVSLLGNHILPLRLGEPLRVTSVLRRSQLEARPVIASAVLLRALDLLAVVALAAICAPALTNDLAGAWVWSLTAALTAVVLLGYGWTARLRRLGSDVRPALAPVLFAAAAAWVLEAAVIWEIARQAGYTLSMADAIAVTAVTIVAQAVAVTPGGFGSYEAAATAGLVALGLPAGAALAIALTTHAVKTGYALVVGTIGLLVPAPSYWGRFRLPRRLPARPVPRKIAARAPVVAIIPVHNEEATVGDVIQRLPATVAGRSLAVLVVDDGSTDASPERAAAAGAIVVEQPRNFGLGAAVRRGLAEAMRYEPAAVVYLDADGEYFPEDIEAVTAPVLSGSADYVVGSRFAGRIERMLPQRRLGNRLLTTWLRWLTRHPVTDGQSGYRAFSAAAAADAEIIHDYNYAQVLTLDLLAKGYVYAEVPIRYAFRSTGASFVKLGRYLRAVVPAVHRELNAH